MVNFFFNFVCNLMYSIKVNGKFLLDTEDIIDILVVIIASFILMYDRYKLNFIYNMYQFLLYFKISCVLMACIYLSKLLYCLRSFHSFGPLITAIFFILSDSIAFGTIFIVVNLLFSILLYITFPNKTIFNSLTSSLLYLV